TARLAGFPQTMLARREYTCTGKFRFLVLQEAPMFNFFLVSMMAFAVFMSISGMESLGQQAEDIYMALGVPKFKKFKIRPFSLMMLPFNEVTDPFKKGYIFKFDEALKSHKKKYRLN
ncbi:hypothetical protein AAKU55_000890, partial [Oxalobacteraceae bacterium GrIS 1.11]